MLSQVSTPHGVWKSRQHGSPGRRTQEAFEEGRVIATFLGRPNRFVMECLVEGRVERAFVANPGRLREILVPGVQVRLQRSSTPGRKLSYTAVGVKREGGWLSLDTHRTNSMVAGLLRKDAIPGLEGRAIVRAEVKHGRSRFDFLLEGPLYLEVKSCTLAGRDVAMFPDAATERGRRHLLHLAELPEETAVVFLVQSPTATVFMPDFHSDLAFARTLLEVKDRVRILPVAVVLGPDLQPVPPARLLEIPWDLVERHAHDRGCYLVHLHLEEPTLVAGRWDLPPAHYVYAGSARAGLAPRLARHRRGSARPHWHIDHLRRAARFVEALPIRSDLDLECELARGLAGVASEAVPGFGSSDCRCPSHLFRFPEDPRRMGAFQGLMLRLRTDRLGPGWRTAGQGSGVSEP